MEESHEGTIKSRVGGGDIVGEELDIFDLKSETFSGEVHKDDDDDEDNVFDLERGAFWEDDDRDDEDKDDDPDDG